MSDETTEKPAQEEAKPAAPQDDKSLEMAFNVAMAMRRETFLAHYPRSLKLFVVVLMLFGLVWGSYKAVAPAPSVLGVEQTQEVAADEEEKPPLYQDVAAINKLAKRGNPDQFVIKTDEQRAAAAENDAAVDKAPLSVAPDMDLVEIYANGYLPIISQDGRTPWQVYARPFNYVDPRPRIAVVVYDLGFSRLVTDAAINRLPSTVTLAFDAQAESVDPWLVRARQDGHETILSLPMEPFDYPRSDPGPGTLLTTIPDADNIERLKNALSKATGYVGVTTLSGSRFISEPDKLAAIMDEFKKRGLLFVDSHVAGHSALEKLTKEKNVPHGVSSRMIDTVPTPYAIDQALADIEQTARIHGFAIAFASPLPVTIERIEQWAQHLVEKGIVLTPVSAVVH